MNFLIFALSLSLSQSCPEIKTVSNFNLTEYIDKTWYIQLQQPTPYLPENVNYCVTARYNIINKKILFYDGVVIGVHNNARSNHVNGTELNKYNTTLCARIPDKNVMSKLLVAPCFLPNIFGGDYWVISAGPRPDNYEWAIVMGGNPTVKLKDGCTTKTDTYNNSGFWFFTKAKNPPKKLIDYMSNIAIKKGLSLEKMNKVEQIGC